MRQINPYDQLLTYKEVVAYLKISKSSLMRMINDEENPLKVTYLAERVTRIKLADINDWLDRANVIYNKKLQEETGLSLNPADNQQVVESDSGNDQS